MEEIKNHLLGGMAFETFAALFIIAMLGVLFSLLIHTTNRDVYSQNSPVRFSFIYMLKDNFSRIFLNIFACVVLIRFCKELTGKDLNDWVAFMLGMTLDKIMELLKNLNFLDRLNFLDKKAE